MNQVLYTKSVAVQPNSLIQGFFARVLKNVSIPCVIGNPTPKAYRQTLQQINEEIATFEEIKVECEREVERSMPFENLTVDSLFKPYLKRYNYLKEVKVHFEMALLGFPNQIDLNFLSDYQDLPLFGVTDLKHHGMKIVCHKEYFERSPRFFFTPNLPSEIEDHYKKAKEILGSNFQKVMEKGFCSISSRPVGQMPSKLREWVKLVEKIELEDSSPLFSGIYIIFEAEWELNKEIYVKKDPIVVGRRVTNDSYTPPIYFLLGGYNLTPLEESILKTHVIPPHYNY